MDFTVNPLYEKMIVGLLNQHYSITDGFFSEEEVKILRHSLLENFETNQFKKSAIGNKEQQQVLGAVRGDFILWINETGATIAEAVFFDKINALTNYLNKTCFLGINQKEFHYALYPPGTFYKRHLDTFQNDQRRKLSLVCYLNDSCWGPENGGELVLYLKKGQVEMPETVHPAPGRVVLFESQVLEHEVKPVLASQRLSITGWLKTR